MAEILKSRFGFRKKNAAADSDAITEPAAAPPRPAGIQRSTFIINPEGDVVKTFKRVKVDGHDQQVLDALKTLQ